MAMETIRVYFQPLYSAGGKTFYHETLVYTDSNGQQFYATAYARKLPPGEDPGTITGTVKISGDFAGASSAAAMNGVSPYGTIITQWGRLSDLPDEKRDRLLGRSDRPYDSQLVKVGDDLSGNWSKTLQAYFQIGEQGLPYSPPTQNSNSAASTGLTAGNMPLPTGTGFSGKHWAPASDVILPTSMTPPAPTPAFRPDAKYSPDGYFIGNFPDRQEWFNERFGKWGSFPASLGPLAPTTRQESLNHRFGNWGSAPAGGFGDTASPVLRALEKYRRSAAPGDSTSASALATPPTTPAFRLAAPVYSAPGDFFGHFPRASAADPPPSSAALNGSGSGPGSRTAGDALARLRRGLDDARQFAGNSLITPAETAFPSQPLWPSPTAPDFPSPTSVPSQLNPAYFSRPNGNPTPDTNESAAPIVSETIRRLGGSTYNQSPASVFDTGAPAVPFVPSDDANFSGGLPGRLAAVVAGMDQTQAPPPEDDEQEQANLRALNARLSSSGHIRDAVALYNALRFGRQ